MVGVRTTPWGSKRRALTAARACGVNVSKTWAAICAYTKSEPYSFQPGRPSRRAPPGELLPVPFRRRIISSGRSRSPTGGVPSVGDIQHDEKEK
eukprot:scaffold144560_cov28-Tisochrysis_lutea.AAC.2